MQWSGLHRFFLLLLAMASLQSGCGEAGSAFRTLLDSGLKDFQAGNRPEPETGYETYATPRNQPLSVPASEGLLRNDRFVDMLIEKSGLTDAGGFVEIKPDGGFAYYPPAEFSGADHFEYEVRNESGHAVSTVLVKVLEPGDVPVP